MRFQDVAVGYAYSILNDQGQAQDAAQEAFIQLYFDLPKLRAPEAFLTWFKRIIFKHCDRLTRRKRLDVVPLDTILQIPAGTGMPAQVWDEGEAVGVVRQLLAGLPDDERTVTVLFYYQDASLKDIAAFLGISPVTVDHRLRSARRHLNEGIFAMAQRDLHDNRPSNSARFLMQVMDGLTRLSNPQGLAARLREEIKISRTSSNSARGLRAARRCVRESKTATKSGRGPSG